MNVAPFGLFDFGVSTGGSWEGGGQPSRGLAVGIAATFTINLIGSDLDELTEDTFLRELSSPPHSGQGTRAFAARFRGFEIWCGPDSDKVPNDPPSILHTPEPNSLALAGIGIVGMAGLGLWQSWKRRRP